MSGSSLRGSPPTGCGSGWAASVAPGAGSTHGRARIAVVRLSPGLGELLCLVPALRALRRGAPGAEITFVGLPGGAWLAERFPSLVDRHLAIPAWPGVPEADGDPAVTLLALAARRPPFDLAIQLHGGGPHVNELTRALGARRVAGHHDPADEPDDPHSFRPWPAHGHEIDRLRHLVTWLGFPDGGEQLELPEQAGDLAALERWIAAGDGDATGGAHPAPFDLDAPFAVVHPGASRADRRWVPAGFAAAVAHLAAAGVRPVVTGTAPERELVELVVALSGVDAVACAGVLPLGGLAALVRRASAVVANDTGVAHLGVAVGTRTVVVAITSDVARWGPLDRVRHRVVRALGDAGRDVADVLGAIDSVLPHHVGSARGARHAVRRPGFALARSGVEPPHGRPTQPGADSRAARR